MKNYKIIIQARSGSTRLPDKMNLPFFNNLTILDIIIQNLLNEFSAEQIILATTVNQKDNPIVETGRKYHINIYRGDEENVINRFIDAAKTFQASNIIRVCADNPFLMTDYILQLINRFEQKSTDYLSFVTTTGFPSIKTHYGFFTEITTLNTLLSVNEHTNEPFFREHVTNYIYANPDTYQLDFITIPEFIENANIRLTVDTLDDFNVCKEIYAYLVENKITIEPKNIINFINKNEHLHQLMMNQINLNKK